MRIASINLMIHWIAMAEMVGFNMILLANQESGMPGQVIIFHLRKELKVLNIISTQVQDIFQKIGMPLLTLEK